MTAFRAVVMFSMHSGLCAVLAIWTSRAQSGQTNSSSNVNPTGRVSPDGSAILNRKCDTSALDVPGKAALSNAFKNRSQLPNGSHQL